MTVTEICLIIIAASMVLGLGIFFFAVLAIARSYKRKVLPLINKTNGVLDNLSTVTLAIRDQVEELRTVMDDITYRTRLMTINVQEKIVPTVNDVVTSISGIARILKSIFGRGKKS
jgi:uncharacterized protein YoxC